MQQLALEALAAGLFLAILVGPILFALVQTCIEQGAKAGFLVGVGIWMGDILFLIVSYAGISELAKIVEQTAFTQIVGSLGGVVLMSIGLVTFLSKPPSIKYESFEVKPNKPYFSLWLKGFFINTINPFTVVFWLSMMQNYVLVRRLAVLEIILFFGLILCVIVFTDGLKIILADKIRKFMRPKHLIWIRKTAGGVITLFGISMLVRVWLW